MAFFKLSSRKPPKACLILTVACAFLARRADLAAIHITRLRDVTPSKILDPIALGKTAPSTFHFTSIGFSLTRRHWTPFSAPSSEFQEAYPELAAGRISIRLIDAPAPSLKQPMWWRQIGWREAAPKMHPYHFMGTSNAKALRRLRGLPSKLDAQKARHVES